jgi:hypothetical protein
MFQGESFKGPGGVPRGSEEAAMPYITDAASDATGQSPIEGVLARQVQALMAINGVKGVAIGRTPTGDDAIVVYLRDASVRQFVPRRVEGFPVEMVITGEIDAYNVPGGTGGQP